jgi:hypothetical protein
MCSASPLGRARRAFSLHASTTRSRLGWATRRSRRMPPCRTPPVSKLDSEVTASDIITDLPVSSIWEQWAGPPRIAIIARLDISRLHFKPGQDRRTQRLTIVAVLVDNHGSFVAGKRSELDLSFWDTTFAQLAKPGSLSQ